VSRLTSTSRHALDSIKRLQLLSPPSSATIEALWAETVSDTPFFPNVQSLIIEASEELYAKDTYSGNKIDLPKVLLEESVLLFD
jgi:hypothetical protein